MDKEISQKLIERAAQVQRGSARAAVLGVNDGLVSVLCIVVGVAAAGGDKRAVITAGLAGMLAGAISMAAGEWISVKAQVELFEGVLHDLKHAAKQDKKILTQNLAANFKRHGMDALTAVHAAKDVARHDKEFLSMYAAQVIGINKDELGSPMRAALSSFLLFLAGAIVPVVPWLVGLDGPGGVILAVLFTALGGLFVGGFTARSSGRGMMYGAIRQLVIIVFAAAVTYGIGHVFGVAIG